jgi:hypothetical protein
MPSSVVATMHYNAELSTLRVVFVSGLVYEYKNVPENVYLEMKYSGAKGVYLNRNIKGNYEYVKLPDHPI